MNVLSPFPGIDPIKAKEIFQINRPLFHFTNQKGSKINLDYKEFMGNRFTLSDRDIIWSPMDFDLSLVWKIKYEADHSRLFHDSSIACSAPGIKLGIALQWFSWQSRQRGTVPVQVFSSKTESMDLCCELTLPKATLRGAVSFVLILYVAGKEDNYTSNSKYATQTGTILGEISEVYTLLLDEYGSEFPMFYEISPGKPLWRLEYDAENPDIDLVTECVRVYFNKANEKAYEMIVPNSPTFNPYLQKEVNAGILIEIIEKVREIDPNFNSINAPEEGSVGQLIKYHVEVNHIDLADIGTVSKTLREFLYNSK